MTCPSSKLELACTDNVDQAEPDRAERLQLALCHETLPQKDVALGHWSTLRALPKHWLGGPRSSLTPAAAVMGNAALSCRSATLTLTGTQRTGNAVAEIAILGRPQQQLSARGRPQRTGGGTDTVIGGLCLDGQPLQRAQVWFRGRNPHRDANSSGQRLLRCRSDMETLLPLQLAVASRWRKKAVSSIPPVFTRPVAAQAVPTVNNRHVCEAGVDKQPNNYCVDRQSARVKEGLSSGATIDARGSGRCDSAFD
jgi:hypothetical protein